MAASKKYYEGIGTRKRAKARVRVYEGSNASTINGEPIDKYFKGDSECERLVLRPFVAAGVTGKLYFTAKVTGGGVTGQVGAIRMGTSRAIAAFDESLEPALKKEDLLSRDPREKERKKYYLLKARKRPQFSKR